MNNFYDKNDEVDENEDDEDCEIDNDCNNYKDFFKTEYLAKNAHLNTKNFKMLKARHI